MPRGELERVLRGDLEDEQAWAILGDLLSAAGDRRGELIALEQRRASATRAVERQFLQHRAEELFAEAYAAWMGPLAKSSALDVEWTRGFIVKATIHRRLVPTLESLLALPAAALLTRLDVPRASGFKRAAKLLADGADLRRLELRDPRFDDLSPVASLATLRRLVVARAAPTELATLGELSRLRALALPGLQTTLDGLGEPDGFPSLVDLDLSFHADPDVGLEPLAARERLRTLDLGHAGWTDLHPIAGLGELEQLTLASTDVYDLRPLLGLQNLRELDLRGAAAVADIEPLGALANLETLRLAYTRIRDVAPLQVLPRLRVLDISGTSIRRPEGLLALPSLERVIIHGSALEDAQPLVDRGIRVDGRPPRALPSWRDLADQLLRDRS